MKKYLDIFLTSLKNNFVKEFIYRSNAIAMTLADLVWIAVEFAFFEIIYSNIGTINGWGKNETFFFLGMFITSDSLFTVFFQRNFWEFPYLVNKGDLDVILTKPANPVFLATTKDINFTQSINLLLGLWVIQHYGQQVGFTGGLSWAWVVFWVILGLAAQFMMRFISVIFSFWLERGITVSALYYQLYSLANKPIGLYPLAIRYLIKTALPFALIGSIPAQAMMGQLSWQDYALVGVTLIFYAYLCRFFWKKGLQRYSSASS